MATKRVFEIAKEQGLSSREVVPRLKEAGLDVSAAASTVDEAEALKVLANGSGPAVAGEAKPAPRPRPRARAPPAGDPKAEAPAAEKPVEAAPKAEAPAEKPAARAKAAPKAE